MNIGFFAFLSTPALAQLTVVETAEGHFAKGHFDLARQKYDEVLSNPFASPADTSLCQCRIGVIDSIQNKQSEARKILEESLRSGSLPSRHSGVCNYALLQIYVMMKLDSEARELLQRMGELQLSATYQARAWALAAEVGSRLNDSRFEVIYLQKLLAIMEKNKFSEVEVKTLGNKKVTLIEVKKRLALDSSVSVTKKPEVSRAQIPILETKPSPQANATSPVSSATMEGLSSTQAVEGPLSTFWGGLREGNYQVAIGAIEQLGGEQGFQRALLSGGIGISASKVVSRLQRLSSEDPRNMRIGVMLPVGPFYTRFNSRIIRSIASFASSSAVRGVTFNFVIRGIAPETGAAEQAATDLIFDDQVHAIIGPVSNSQTLGATGISQLFGVPVFALGPVVLAPEIANPFLVRMGILAKSQAIAMVKHLREDLKVKNAAILAPNDPYGYETASQFEIAARDSAITIQNVRNYSASAEVFKDDVNAVVGPQDPESRTEELEQQVELAREKAKKEKKHFDPKKIMLAPILPFDVLLVPDSLSRVKVIASTFAFFGSPHVKILGDRQWADSATGRSSLADPFMNGARVPVPFDGDFLAFLRKDLGSPDAYLDLERQVFDALVLVRTAQFRAGGSSGGKMLNAMREKDWNARGTMIFGPVDDSGEPLVKFSIMNYQNGKIISTLAPWAFQPSPPSSDKASSKTN